MLMKPKFWQITENVRLLPKHPKQIPCQYLVDRINQMDGQADCRRASIRVRELGMLRRAENVSITHRVSFWTRKGPIIVKIGRQIYPVGKMPESEFAQRQEVQLQRPIALIRIGEKVYWQFQNRIFWENEGLKSKEVYALLVTRDQRRRDHIDRAQATVIAGSSKPQGAGSRKRIPDDLKQLVWTRDDGECQNCGSRTELQFDHIIPLALNGSGNAENLQLLCGPCNRRKSSGLTISR
ncbi:MAG: HNH endonuclease [Micrococcaceae bacterium]|nr:HNH endonuclease [Micrococcaceae bacterium]